jgi:FHA domain-containing protein
MGGVSANPPIEAERAGQPFLLYKDGAEKERRFALDPGQADLSVGRQPSSDLVLDWDDKVSRLHAKLERAGEDWTVVDDGLSRNGTFVNGERLSGRRLLHDGDSIRFGATTVTFRSPQAAPQAAAPAGGDAPSVVDLSTSQRRVLAALCRPFKGGSVYANPPTNGQIADELFLSGGAVHTHLSVMYVKFGIDELPDDEKRVRLVERAIQSGVISDSDL